MNKQYIINDVSKHMAKLVEKNCFDIDKYLSDETVDMTQLANDFLDCLKDTFDRRYLIGDEIKFYKSLWCKIVCAGNKRFL